MAETEINHIEAARPRKLRFDWVFPLFFKPGRTLKAVTAEDIGVWLAPLLILTLFAVLAVVVGGPIRAQQAQPTGELPPDFQYWMPEQQEQYLAGQANRASPLFIYGFPIMGALASVWIPWFLLGSILHLVLTMSGSRGTNTATLNLVGWASLPMAIRYIVQAVYILVSGQLLKAPGVSGFVSADAGGFSAFVRSLLTQVDLYWIWMVILLLAGVLPLTGLRKGKAWFAVLISVVIMLALQGLPGFVAASLSGLSTTRPFF